MSTNTAKKFGFTPTNEAKGFDLLRQFEEGTLEFPTKAQAAAAAAAVAAAVGDEHPSGAAGTAASPVATGPPTFFTAGENVRLLALQSKPEMNGQVGVCKDWNAASLRWTVSLQDGTELALKEANLERFVQQGIGLRLKCPVNPMRADHQLWDRSHILSDRKLVSIAVQTSPIAPIVKEVVKEVVRVKEVVKIKEVVKEVVVIKEVPVPAKASAWIKGNPPVKSHGSGVQTLTGKLGPSPLAGNDLAYVKCETCGQTLEMVVDLGAQMSVISAPLLERLNLEGKMEASNVGVARGAGSTNILGICRNIPVKIGNAVAFNLDLSVIEMGTPMMILGMDQLRRYRCIMDLDNEFMVFGGTGGIEVPFIVRPQGLPQYM